MDTWFETVDLVIPLRLERALAVSRGALRSRRAAVGERLDASCRPVAQSNYLPEP